jgi:hypothetical protein
MSRHGRPALSCPQCLLRWRQTRPRSGSRMRNCESQPACRPSNCPRRSHPEAYGASVLSGQEQGHARVRKRERMEQCRPTWEAFMTELTAARRAHHRAMERMHRNRQYHKQHPEARTKAEVLARVNVPVRPPKRCEARVVKPKKAKQRGPVPLLVGKMQPKRTPRPKDERPVVIPAARQEASSTVRAARTPATASPLGSSGSFPNSGANCAREHDEYGQGSRRRHVLNLILALCAP